MDYTVGARYIVPLQMTVLHLIEKRHKTLFTLTKNNFLTILKAIA
jgi:hypothetical protein